MQKSPLCLHDKSPRENRDEGYLPLNTIKTLYVKSSSNIIPDKEKAHQSNLINCLIAMTLFNIMLEVIAREIR